MSRITKKFLSAIQTASKTKTSPYDTTAEVRRIEGNIAWVHIPGGVDETPVKLTIDAKKGDSVQVRVSGGKAFLVGNSTAPPTDDTTAKQADSKAVQADRLAQVAQQAADDARKTATNYLSWNSNDGLIISEDATENPSEMTGGLTRITSSGVGVFQGQTKVAGFGQTVTLGDENETQIHIGQSSWGESALYFDDWDGYFTPNRLRVEGTDANGHQNHFYVNTGYSTGPWLEITDYNHDNVNGIAYSIHDGEFRVNQPMYTANIISSQNISPAMGFGRLLASNKTVTATSNTVVTGLTTVDCANSELFDVMDEDIIINKSGYYRVFCSWTGNATLTNSTNVKVFGVVVNYDTTNLLCAAVGRSLSWNTHSQESIEYFSANEAISLCGRNEAGAGGFDRISAIITPLWIG